MSDVSMFDAPVPSSDVLVAAFWAIPHGVYTTQTLLHRLERRLRDRGHAVTLERVDDLRRLKGATATEALAILAQPGLQQPTDPSAAASLVGPA